MRTPKDEQPKAAAAKRGCLTARHWQDLRQAARLARSEGVTLIVHGVTVSPHCKENLQCSDNMTKTTGLDERGQQQTEAVDSTCEHSSKRQHDQQQQTKQQREDQRSLLRLRAFQQAVACGARWLPLVQKLLRRNRATSRDNVWTSSHMRRTLALRDKMRDFLGRVLCAAISHNNTWTQVQKSPASPSGALGEGMLRQLAQRLRVRCNIKAAHMVMMPVYTRNFLSTYVQEHNVAAAHAMLRLQDLRNLFMNYKVARNQEAAMASIIPIDENNPCRHTLSDSPPEKRGAKRARKPKGKGRR